jgi:hypothetical protein
MQDALKRGKVSKKRMYESLPKAALAYVTTSDILHLRFRRILSEEIVESHQVSLEFVSCCLGIQKRRTWLVGCLICLRKA